MPTIDAKQSRRVSLLLPGFVTFCFLLPSHSSTGKSNLNKHPPETDR